MAPRECSSGPALGTPDYQRPGTGLDVGDGVGVGLDATGHDNLAAGVDDLGRRGREEAGKCYGHNLLALDPHVPVAYPSWGDNATSLNEHVEHG